MRLQDLSCAWITQLDAENKMLKGRVEEAEQDMSRQESNTESVVSRINDLDQCQHCETAFTLKIEGHSLGRAAIRCKGCRIRSFI